MNPDPAEKRVKSIVVILVLAVFFALFYYWVRRPLGPESINKLVIKGHQKLTTREIVTILGIQPGVSFEQFHLGTLENNLRIHPRVKDARISQQFDNRLFISIVERNAAFVVNSGGHLYEIDNELNIISTDDVREPALLVISGEFSHSRERFTSSRMADLVKFIGKMFADYPALKDRMAEINLSADGEIYIYTYRPAKLKVLMGNTLDMTQVRKLYAALSYFEAEGKDAGLLDLRGEDAVYH